MAILGDSMAAGKLTSSHGSGLVAENKCQVINTMPGELTQNGLGF